jgi:hypothetical protein
LLYFYQKLPLYIGMNKTGWFKLEAFNNQGWSRGLAYFASKKEALAMSRQWLKIPSVVKVTVCAA